MINNLLDNELKHHRSEINKQKQNTILLKEFEYNTKQIVYSVIVPVYNQETIIVKNLESIINCMGDTFEIIIIIDYCQDKTKENILNFCNTLNHKLDNFIKVSIFVEENTPLFEASCDNIGFIHSKGKYCLEIQSDMQMIEPNFNLHLQKPFNKFNNLIAVSGRCAHNFFSHNTCAGKTGLKIEKSLKELNINKNIFYEYETCNRGPLLLDREKLKELTYLDEKNWFLDNSDHDLMFRALKYNYICGYVPIDFLSPLSDGSTRKNVNKNKLNEIVRELRKNESEYKCNFQLIKPLNYVEKKPVLHPI